MTEKRVIVVGAGISGLTAARVLHRNGYSVKVLEKDGSPGGRVGNETCNGISVNKGARLLYSFSEPFNQLLDELGLTSQMQSAGQLTAACTGREATWPIYLMPGIKSITTPGLGVGERLRLLRHAASLWSLRHQADPDDAASVMDADTQSLHTYITNTVGPEFLNRIVEPVFVGARVWRPEDISAAFYLTTAPNLFGTRVTHPASGMQVLPQALATGLDIETGVQVTTISQGDTCRISACRSESQVTYEADYVICALPGDLIPPLVESLDSTELRFFQQVEYNSYGAVHYLLNQRLPEKMSFFDRDTANGVALYQQTPLQQHTQVYLQLTPELVAIARNEHSTDQLDHMLAERASTLCPTLKSHCIARHNQWIERMLPLFKTGYCRQMKKFRDRQDASPRRIYYCGDYLAQALVNGAVASGRQAADSLMHHWGCRSPA